jgi:hypothetical protein
MTELCDHRLFVTGTPKIVRDCTHATLILLIVINQFHRVILLDGRRKYEGIDRGGGN